MNNCLNSIRMKNHAKIIIAFSFILLTSVQLHAGVRLLFRQFQPLINRGAKYVGQGTCRKCHDDVFNGYNKTKHAKAFLTLTSRGKEDDTKCIACHVTGYGETGGFKNIDESIELAGVQCEACHGPASLHVEKIEVGEFSISLCTPCHSLGTVEGIAAECDRCHPNFRFHIDKLKRKERIVRNAGEDACKECHDADNDPEFKYSSELPGVVHRPPVDITPEEEEKEDIVLLPSMPGMKGDVEYVGNDACIKCHSNAYRKWLSTGHSKSYETLVKQQAEKTTRCLRCHSTGYGKRSGFIDEKNTPSLKEVGCETCHGPGKDHVEADEGRKKNTIYGINSDCPSCSAARTCKRCHTIREDPDFDTARDLELIRCDR